MGNKKGKQGSQERVPTSCKYNACKQAISKYGFCTQHFDEFKFGLINKHGQLVPDYQKKLEHFMRQKKHVA